MEDGEILGWILNILLRRRWRRETTSLGRFEELIRHIEDSEVTDTREGDGDYELICSDLEYWNVWNRKHYTLGTIFMNL